MSLTVNKTLSGYMSKSDVKAYVGGIANTTLHDWIAKKGFPRPFYISSRRPTWRKADVSAWMEAQALNSAGVKGGTR